jgi:hypothetical protein
MTQEQRKRVMAADYNDVLDNPSVRQKLADTVSKVPENIDELFDRAVEECFGLRIADFDDESLEHARVIVRRARHRLVK